MGKEIQANSCPVLDKMEQKASINGFEGVEKRLELAFTPISSNLTEHDGLRLLTRSQIDNFLELAGCTIVSELHNSCFDSYILSESSLFIYPLRIILKTCGRTQVLQCISLLLSYASGLSLQPCFCKYTHGTFIFPLEQPFPYTCFEEEVKYLDSFFGDMGSHAYTMGMKGLPNWHIYSAATHSYSTFTNSNKPIYTLEMGMTHLSKTFTTHFFNESGLKTGREMTESSSIDKIWSNASICDFAFAPCGYSMNGIEGDAFSTIHVTPEETHSYGSFEAMGCDSCSVNLQELVERVVSIFQPGRMAMSIHASRLDGFDVDGTNSWSSSSVVPLGYVCDSTQRHLLPQRSVVAFHTFIRSENEETMQINIPKPMLPPWHEMFARKKEMQGINVDENVESFCYFESKKDELRKRSWKSRNW